MVNSLLVFGGGPLQLSIIEVANSMGFQTIVIDPDADAPGKKEAGFFYVISGNDYERTLEIAKKHDVKGIVTAATDKPILMMCQIAKELNLPFPSFESCVTLLDKAKFKTFLSLNNLPHAKGVLLQGSSVPPQNGFEFPIIIKPVVNSGSRGVIRVNNQSELPNAIAETLKHSYDKRFLIEEFIEGDEISVEALVQKRIVHIVQITDKNVSLAPYNVEMGHVQPSKYEYLKDKIRDLLQIIVDKTGLDNCALHPEIKVNDGKITIIEVGPRLGGDYITSHLVKLSTGVNIEQELVNLSVGKVITLSNSKMASLISYFDFPINSRIKNTFNKSELKEKFPEIVSVGFDLRKGDKVGKITNSLDRYGYVILKGDNIESISSVLEKVKSYLFLKLI